MKLLLLGSSGSLGSYAKKFIHGAPAYSLIAPTRSQLGSLGNGTSISGIKAAIDIYEPDVVLNLIAETSLAECETDSGTSQESNLLIPKSLAEVLPKNSLLIHMSTDAVFGGGQAPYSIVDQVSPTSKYGLQKYQGEAAIVEQRANYLIIRASFFGPSRIGRLGTLQFFKDKLLQNESVDGFVDYINNPVSMHSLMKGIIRGIEKDITGTLHLGAQGNLSKYTFGVFVARALGVEEKLVKEIMAPEGFHAHGGLDLTLESNSSWEKLGLAQPTTWDGIVESLCEDKIATRIEDWKTERFQ